MSRSLQVMPSALLVFGGTGFVGTVVIAKALARCKNLKIFVISRSGVAPQWLLEDPIYNTDRLTFLSGDLHQPATVHEALQTFKSEYNFLGCVSCVGVISPFSQENMVRTCGDANINAYNISKEVGANKFAVITRDRSNMDDWWYPFPYIIPGYYKGKQKIEHHIINDGENIGNAICLRAGFVVGTRRTLPGVSGSIKVKIPMRFFYNLIDQWCPTIAVESLAGAAVRFVLSDKKAESTIVLNETIDRFFEKV